MNTDEQDGPRSVEDRAGITTLMASFKDHLRISAFICGFALLSAGAAGAAELKIGFVNTERVFREAAPAKRAQQKLEREFAVRNTELAKLEKQGRDLQGELERENMTITESARRDKERALADISRNFQRLQREIREDLNQRRNEELAGVQERATRVINQIAEQEKFDLVVQEAVFASVRIDITDKVIRALADK